MQGPTSQHQQQQQRLAARSSLFFLEEPGLLDLNDHDFDEEPHEASQVSQGSVFAFNIPVSPLQS
jgi:hypothetical protein